MNFNTLTNNCGPFFNEWSEFLSYFSGISSPIFSLHIYHVGSSTGILCHRPVSIGIFKLEVLNFVFKWNFYQIFLQIKIVLE